MVKLLTTRKKMVNRAIRTITIPVILLNLFFFPISCKKSDTKPTGDVAQSKIVMRAETNRSATITPNYVISFNTAKTLVTATASAGSGLANYSGTFNAVIANAIAALKTNGGVIMIDNGNYINLTPILIPYPNITIEGQGTATTVLKFEAKADAVLTTYMNLINVTANNFLIKKIK